MTGAGPVAAAGTLRMFVAIDLPADVQRRLLALVPEAAGVRPVAVGQAHLTIHFLGDVAIDAVAALGEALAAVDWHGFPVVVAGGGRFPPRGPAAVLWAGVRESSELRDLHAAVGAAIGRLGHAVETRPFVPHVTVARVRGHAGRAAVDGFLRAAEGQPALQVSVERFHLYRSDRGPGGQVHAVVRSFRPAS